MTVKDIAIIITAVAVPCLMFLAGGIYHICEYIKSKRPHKSDDEEDNPIVKFKDDLAEIYEDYPNGKLKKLAQAVWNRVVEIEKWHNEEIHDWERKYYSAKWEVGELSVKCDGYREELDEWTQRCEELQSKLNEQTKQLKESEKCLDHSLEREANLLKANEGLHKLLKEEQEKNKIPIFSDQTEVPAYLISENTFGGQINPFSKIIVNTGEGKPLTATEATDLAERLQNMTSKPIVLDSEKLNEPTIKNEEFIKQLRDWWGLEASKAVELPNTGQKKQDDGWVDAIEAARDPNKWPEYMAKVEGIPKDFNKYKVTLYDNKENETIETELWGANIYDAMKSIDNERYGVVGYRCVMRNKGWC